MNDLGRAKYEVDSLFVFYTHTVNSDDVLAEKQFNVGTRRFVVRSQRDRPTPFLVYVSKQLRRDNRELLIRSKICVAFKGGGERRGWEGSQQRKGGEKTRAASRIVAIRPLMRVPVSPLAFARSCAMSRQGLHGGVFSATDKRAAVCNARTEREMYTADVINLPENMLRTRNEVKKSKSCEKQEITHAVALAEHDTLKIKSDLTKVVCYYRNEITSPKPGSKYSHGMELPHKKNKQTLLLRRPHRISTVQSTCEWAVIDEEKRAEIDRRPILKLYYYACSASLTIVPHSQVHCRLNSRVARLPRVEFGDRRKHSKSRACTQTSLNEHATDTHRIDAGYFWILTNNRGKFLPLPRPLLQASSQLPPLLFQAPLRFLEFRDFYPSLFNQFLHQPSAALFIPPRESLINIPIQSLLDRKLTPWKRRRRKMRMGMGNPPIAPFPCQLIQLFRSAYLENSRRSADPLEMNESRTVSKFSITCPRSLVLSLFMLCAVIRCYPADSDAIVCVYLDSLGARVAERLACSPITKTNRVHSPVGSLRIFACGNRADDAVGRRVFSGISPTRAVATNVNKARASTQEKLLAALVHQQVFAAAPLTSCLQLSFTNKCLQQLRSPAVCSSRSPTSVCSSSAHQLFAAEPSLVGLHFQVYCRAATEPVKRQEPTLPCCNDLLIMNVSPLRATAMARGRSVAWSGEIKKQPHRRSSHTQLGAKARDERWFRAHIYQASEFLPPALPSFVISRYRGVVVGVANFSALECTGRETQDAACFRITPLSPSPFLITMYYLLKRSPLERLERKPGGGCVEGYDASVTYGWTLAYPRRPPTGRPTRHAEL
ncbi:hypothetical protein PR048_022433 [Dryococelus australis]|uniref:Uncharacterized protein n=1 Tax=Dryococelus australis TaxID=614101 RepID=A0ABQ9H113_9NEOP|nr:hypothetical protein PR048_022433 [Dryococelus australis]